MWKGNKCHPFNSRRGRLKGPKKYMYNMGPKRDSFLRKECFLLFCSRRTAYIVRDMRKIYISRFILQGRNIIFKNILRVRCSSHKI